MHRLDCFIMLDPHLEQQRHSSEAIRANASSIVHAFVQNDIGATRSAIVEQAVTNVKFGAKDVMDLTWKNALDAYSCTECGRCTEQCPANQTGRALSPRKIMMDTRDRLEEVGAVLKLNKGLFVDDGKSLFDRISDEELRACTSCQACVEACPMELPR